MNGHWRAFSVHVFFCMSFVKSYRSLQSVQQWRSEPTSPMIYSDSWNWLAAILFESDKFSRARTLPQLLTSSLRCLLRLIPMRRFMRNIRRRYSLADKFVGAGLSLRLLGENCPGYNAIFQLPLNAMPIRDETSKKSNHIRAGNKKYKESEIFCGPKFPNPLQTLFWIIDLPGRRIEAMRVCAS